MSGLQRSWAWRIGEWCAALPLALALAAPSAGAVTSAQQQAIRAATFEVVMKKPEHDPLSYERPLPFELLPFQQRNDAYDSIGTAFALGHNTYVTAGHVLLAGINSQHGAPALRGSDGHVHPIERIRRFSVHEDFVVFSLQDDPAPPGFEINRTPAVDSPVLAVGNALGEGVVIREGLYTSDTPEEQDGRWKWIRFSAAASPGNSGGPLLDGDAHVIGIVIGKSENENLNYSLPIARVLDAPEGVASFDQRVLVRLPWLHDGKTYSYQEQFKLPLAWAEFARSYQAVGLRRALDARAQLLAAHADALFPKGAGTEALLYDADSNDFLPWLVSQKADGSWAGWQPGFTTTELPGDGAVRVASLLDASLLLQLVRPDDAADDAFYADSAQFINLVLKGLNLRRPVGQDAVRVVGAGKAASEELHTDRYGRRWQVRAWPLPFMEVWMITVMVPTPDGYAGFVQYAQSAAFDEVRDQALRYTDLMEISYRGTLAQWRAFLARRALLPDALREVSLSAAPEWQLSTPRFGLAVPAKLYAPDEHGILTLSMGFQPQDGQARWDINDAWFFRDRQMRLAVGARRRIQPPSSARVELRNSWQDMNTRHGSYDGAISRESDDVFALSTVMNVPGHASGMAAADLIYALTLHVDSGFMGQNPLQLESLLLGALQVREVASGAVVPASSLARGSRAGAVQLEAMKVAFRRTVVDRNLIGQRDLRGRTVDDDLDAMFAKLGAAAGGGAPDMDALSEAVRPLIGYWLRIAGINHLRAGWGEFLAQHHLPANSTPSAAVSEAETQLRSALANEAQREQWPGKADVLLHALMAERRDLLHAQLHGQPDMQTRKAACPAAAAHSSGREAPAFDNLPSTESYYPELMRKLGIEGSVILRVQVSTVGCADQLGVLESSGVDELDHAALEWAESVTFLPGEREGKPSAAGKDFKVTFKMNDY